MSMTILFFNIYVGNNDISNIKMTNDISYFKFLCIIYIIKNSKYFILINFIISL